MKLSLAFLFVSVLAVSLVAAQDKAVSTGQNPAASTQNQQITNGPVAEYVSDSNCTIGWSTSASGSLSLRYGTEPTKMTQDAGTAETKDGHNYHVQLDGLAPRTRYYFQVLNAAEPISGVGTFETVAKDGSPVRSKVVIPQ